MVDVGCRGVGAGFSRWSAFSYDRLPAQQLRLTIVKLDGSSFDVQVVKSASVTELKLAVEEIFSGSPRGGGAGISWSHVWGHFCLCYMNQKLTDNKASLKTFGIKDGDKLHFVRHVSINYNPIRQQPRKNGGSSEQQRIGAKPNISSTSSSALSSLPMGTNSSSSSTAFVFFFFFFDAVLLLA
ncbi:unnamed protein product [Spirodela intermedia]|uniref:SNRNP25 ubiquitin-like domain-containing protein n=1 Tax=Spirodela intermedia TaxID=51605 RepID=A0A7I8LC99_SPIIN|nr:unnamed protein product [Spirodela intermedia]